ncbi:MAG: glutamate synthase-related protein [Methanomassiliicoccales archaeon]|nr:glutamate synthase-related protein [Methanomassiliicoccales archaeon]
MYERYHVPKKEMPPAGVPFSKSSVIRSDRCMNCGRCKDACVYGVHERDASDPRTMAEPKSHLCKNCLRCVEDCPQRALSVELSPLYLGLGGGLWTPQRVFTIWNEAWTGKIPVFGAGYRGKFVGPGYDSMWTDMSEIVRPTRDGIHGREFISTSVDLGKRVDYLEFDEAGRLMTKMPGFVELPIPMVLDLTRIDLTPQARKGLMQAAKTLGTLFIAPAEGPLPNGSNESMVPVFASGRTSANPDLSSPRMVEVEHSSDWRSDLRALKERFGGAAVGIRIQARNGVESEVVELASSEVDVVHILYDEQGQEADGRLAKDSLMAVNRALVTASLRERVSIIAGGGLAAAEHVPKSLICGADAVGLERALKVALGCQACADCDKDRCMADRENVTSDWSKWRAVNLIGAWRDQLLEVMGAMGMREARRLRGEIGRAIFFEEAEKDAFAGIKGGA